MAVDPNDGLCTLIEAITAANTDTASGPAAGECPAGSGADTIVLQAGATYTLTVANNSPHTGPNGLPAIATPVTITGNGATIQRSGAAGTPEFRLFDVESGGDLRLEALTVRGGLVRSCYNNADPCAGGGGIRVAVGGKLTVVNAAVTGNTVLNEPDLSSAVGLGGGGISSLGTLTVMNSVLSDNSAVVGGGGIEVASGTASVLNSTITRNHAPAILGYDSDGGGIEVGESQAADLDVTGSTISANDGAKSGGLGVFGGHVNLANSTISGNRATAQVDPATGRGGITGGGIYTNGERGVITLLNVTIAGNSADDPGTVNPSAGGLRANSVTAINTIVAGNTVAGSNAAASADCVPEVPLGHHNLYGQGTGCGSATGTATVVPGTTFTSVLGPLADNGGPTQTHALLIGSPALLAGDAATCAAAPVSGVDQRGVVRPPGLCDIGAFQGSAADIIVNDNGTAVDPSDGKCTLKEAIVAANTRIASGSKPGECGAGGVTSVIRLEATPAIYTLSQVNNTTEGPTGLPVLTSTATVVGNNAIIERSSAAGTPPFRLLLVGAPGNLTLDGVTMRNGEAGQFNGGAALSVDPGATLVLTNSTLTGNRAPSGGGGALYSGGTATLRHVTVSNNQAGSGGQGPGVGGGIDSDGVLTIIDSAIVNNVVASTQPGSVSGGVWSDGPTLLVLRSTISGNSAPQAGGLGTESTTTVANSTISGNSATRAVSTNNIGGGGFFADVGGNVTIINSTIVNNSSADPNRPGGLYVDDITVTLTNTILAGNTTAGSATAANADCALTAFPASQLTSNGHNVVGAGTGCPSTGAGDKTVAPATVFTAVVGPLANNGGPTQTHALINGSPARDAGDNAVCAAAPVSGIDQRGVTRPQGPACDIGAFEAAVVAPSADLSVTLTHAPEPVSVGQPLTFTATVTNAGPSPATGVRLTDTLPGNVTFGAATPSQGTCTPGAGTVSCSLGTLANGGSATVQVSMTPTAAAAGGTLTGSADVTANEADPNSANNHASDLAHVTVLAGADLAVTLTASNLTPAAGSNITLTATVSNLGPSDSSGVAVTVLLPGLLSFVSASPAPAYTPGNGRWTVGTLTNGATATLQLVVTVNSLVPLDVAAKISASGTADPNPANDEASVHLVPQSTGIIVNDNGIAQAPNDGKCTLIEAIIAANTQTPSGPRFGECAGGPGVTTIYLRAPSPLFSLRAVHNTTFGPTALPVVTGIVTIEGGNATIERGPQLSPFQPVPAFSLLSVAAGASLTLKDLTVRGGSTSHCGGGLYNEGTLALVRVTVRNNAVADATPGTHDVKGGGICNWRGTLTLDSSTVAANTATAAGFGSAEGGGIFTLGGTTALTNHSAVRQNVARAVDLSADGGGIAAEGGQSSVADSVVEGNITTAAATAREVLGGGAEVHNGTLELTRSTVRANAVTGGGAASFAPASGGGLALWNSSATLTESTIGGVAAADGNTAGFNGGGIVVFRSGAAFAASLTMTGGAISHNTANGDGGGGGLTGGLSFAGPTLPGTVTLDGVTVDSNHATNAGGRGGGIFIFPGGSLTLRRGMVSNNSANDGGGIHLYGTGAPVSISDSTIRGNTAANVGGGIVNYSGSQLTLDHTTIEGNQADYGGGVRALFSGETILRNKTVIRANHAVHDGGGVFVLNNVLTVTDSTIGGPAPADANTAGRDGGGISNNLSGTITVTDVTLSHNVAALHGGGISNDRGVVTVTGTTSIDHNTDTNVVVNVSGGGGIYNSPGGTLTLTDTVLSANKATGWYGALHNAGTATLIHVTLTGNTTDTFGGGAIGNFGTLTVTNSTFNQNAAGSGFSGYGGALEQFAGTTILDSTTMTGNSASWGGAIVLWVGGITLRNGTVLAGNTTRAGGSGGGIYAPNPIGGTTVVVRDSTVRDNMADQDGGGIALAAGASLSLTNAAIHDNTAVRYGGGISNDHGTVIATGTTSIDHNHLTGNSARGGGIHNSVGASLTLTDTAVSFNTSAVWYGGLNNDGTATLTRVTMSQNTTALLGGGAIGTTGTLTITGSTLSRNSAGDGFSGYGGAIEQYDGSVVLDSTTLSGNVASAGGAVVIFGGTMRLRNGSVVAGNTARANGGDGGGIFVANWDGTARLDLTDSSVRDNLAPTGSGGGIASAGTLTITRTTVSGNTAGSRGGGLSLSPSTATVANSTLSGNAAADGGGIFTTGASLMLSFLTVAGNQATTRGGGIAGPTALPFALLPNSAFADTLALPVTGLPEGIVAVAALPPPSTLTSSIIAGNRQGGSATISGADCSGAPRGGGTNLTGQGTGCPSRGAGDKTVAPATVFTTVLGPLANNGGPTLTHALLAGSPAIDAGPATCAAPPVGGVDQRGTRRPQGAACDIGAYER